MNIFITLLWGTRWLSVRTLEERILLTTGVQNRFWYRRSLNPLACFVTTAETFSSFSASQVFIKWWEGVIGYKTQWGFFFFIPPLEVQTGFLGMFSQRVQLRHPAQFLLHTHKSETGHCLWASDRVNWRLIHTKRKVWLHVFRSVYSLM